VEYPRFSLIFVRTSRVGKQIQLPQFSLSGNVKTEVEVVADGTLSIYNLQTLAKMKEEE
jgi:hypothetical protein